MALVHDIVVTAGIYSIVGFEVTPATVIGLLTILGFSLYDTVVVFDKVKENTRGLAGATRRTYAEAANLALNQTLMRSINTSLIAVLPVVGLLVVGVGLLGVGHARGPRAGAVGRHRRGRASPRCFLATPLLVDLKKRDAGATRQQAARVLARRRNARQLASPRRPPRPPPRTTMEPAGRRRRSSPGSGARERAVAGRRERPGARGQAGAQPAARPAQPARRRGRPASGTGDRRPEPRRWRPDRARSAARP